MRKLLATSSAGNLTQTTKIAATQEARIDWRVKVLDEGQARSA